MSQSCEERISARKLVVAFPILPARDFFWIQKVRQVHDEMSFNAVAPHFTFVRPSNFLHSEALRRKASLLRSFSFRIRSAQLVPPLSGQAYGYVFLVPDEPSPFTYIRKQLHLEELEETNGECLPFIPHITVASDTDFSKLQKLVENLNAEDINICGEIRKLSILCESGSTLNTLESFSLSTSAGDISDFRCTDKRVVVRTSPIHGKGLFAITPIQPGETVVQWKKHELSRQEFKALPEIEHQYIDIQGEKIFLMGEPERFVNHSCIPNTYPGHLCDIASRNIEPGEEITTDYAHFFIPGEQFICAAPRGFRFKPRAGNADHCSRIKI